MMKYITTYLRHILCSLCLLGGVLTVSADPSALTASADSAYMADDYSLALQLYQQTAETYGTSSALYCNIGNCQYRLGNPGQAILAYERALKLNPSDADARENLAFVRSRIVDRPGESGSFLSNSYDAIADAAQPNTWAWLAFGTFVLFLCAAGLYVFTSRPALRKTGFFGGICLIVITVGLILVTVRAASRASDTERGVIISSSTILSTTPRQPKDRNEEAMLLHEGTTFTILDSVSAAPGDSSAVVWYDVRIDNAHRAWIRSTDIERI